MNRFALVNFGNEESYGLLFAAAEFKRQGYDIHFFDSEMSDVVPDIIDYNPDYIGFSPLTPDFHRAKAIEMRVKEHNTRVISVYGGHHATNCNENIGDITCIGGVYDLDLSKRGMINNGAVKPWHLKWPAREEYYRDIPRMAQRYRKVMLSVHGCPFACSYCSSSAKQHVEKFGPGRENLTHRDIDDLIAEGKFVKAHNTFEIEWVDDDVFFGDPEWLRVFYSRWQEEVGLPMYVSSTSIQILKVKPEIMQLMRKSVNCIGMGVQAARADSLKLLNRQWDNRDQLKRAYAYMQSFGYRVNIQGIVGLPVEDTLGDALDTIDCMRDIGPGSVASVYPLQIYPGTAMDKIIKDKGMKYLPTCTGDTSSALPAIDFGEQTNKRLRNICKLATMVILFNIDRRWLEVLMDLDFSDEVSKKLSEVRYFECINDRNPENSKEIFTDIFKTMKLKY